jgi:2,4-didehydro-3-deoxy-L-rhamnonate hydrolase
VAFREAQCPAVPDFGPSWPLHRAASKLICIGLNYSRHAKESGMEIPKKPILLMKASSSMASPNDDIVIPKSSKKSHWEVELAVVMGKRSLYVGEREAMDYLRARVAVPSRPSDRFLQPKMRSPIRITCGSG